MEICESRIERVVGKGIGHYRNGDRQIYFDGRYEYADGNMGEINDLKIWNTGV